MNKRLGQFVFALVVLCVILFLMSGCQGQQMYDIADEVNTVNSQVAAIAQAVGQASYNDNEMLNLLYAAQAGNAASAPFNPYVIPIGAGLSGVIGVLEALRRKEKDGRKYAEHELRNGRNNNGTGRT